MVNPKGAQAFGVVLRAFVNLVFAVSSQFEPGAGGDGGVFNLFRLTRVKITVITIWLRTKIIENQFQHVVMPLIGQRCSAWLSKRFLISPFTSYYFDSMFWQLLFSPRFYAAKLFQHQCL